MNLQLKNIKFYESMSEETNCFQADLFIDGKKITHVKNDGRGGCTEYHHIYDFADQQIVRDAEAYCLTLPKEMVTPTLEWQPTLESEIDRLFEQWLKAKADKKFHDDMNKGIMYGSRENYTLLSWKGRTLVQILNLPQGEMTVKQKVKELIGKGETILNTNLPQGFI